MVPRKASGSVCVFAKPPVAGVSKTRLAAGVGPERAARLAGAFLTDTLRPLSAIPGLRLVLSTTDVEGDFGPIPEVERVPQGGGDLGARVARTLSRELERGPWTLALGADSPGLPVERIHEAIAALEAGRAVLGPTEDGGFYLLGLCRCPEGLLADLPWSSPETAAATWARLVDHGLAPIRLAPWFDLDEVADLERFRHEVPRSRAPATWAALNAP